MLYSGVFCFPAVELQEPQTAGGVLFTEMHSKIPKTFELDTL